MSSLLEIPLTGATQSSRNYWGCCSTNPCTADRAIDGDTTSSCNFAHTALASEGAWWSAEMTKVARIEQILAYVPSWEYKQGYYRHFKVETRLSKQDAWKVCKGEYSMNEPYDPHEIQCDQDTVAKYIRLSVRGNVHLVLNEVRVIGTPTASE